MSSCHQPDSNKCSNIHSSLLQLLRVGCSGGIHVSTVGSAINEQCFDRRPFLLGSDAQGMPGVDRTIREYNIGARHIPASIVTVGGLDCLGNIRLGGTK